ncbi:hypothetical protein Mlute_01545 [Meiothermus luteus]|jgi:hypothetical protein|uniref:Uncharacterized protein n=1 Tax=Meiothermus luteus TaxID=2026184 RepID=A0A399EPZ1_9DEIN|nr:hypothetical protein [Meiothermus luteus]RIH85550.1 hypothetical protein Mlute_01545 [Meiothermus luteus]RMH57501.1 MAG: hypothetical protein D6684_03530 [Deinococcota bacterium]
MLELHTNAPAHWPRVRLEGLIPSNAPEVQTANRLLFSTTIETVFRRSGIQVLEADVLRLTREGVVEIPLRVRDGELEYDLFFYPVADEKAAAHYVAVYELAQKWGRLRPVFYSTDDLLAIYPAEIEPVARRDRLYIQAALSAPKGQYAMWWAERPGELFHYSSTYDLFDRIYREINGLEMRAFALILLELGMIREEYEFTASSLTDTTVEIPVEGPEGVPLIITFSQHRGVRFHFHIGRTSAEYRDLFLNLFLLRLKAWRKETDLTQARRLDSPSYTWWRELGKRLRMTDNGEQAISAVGSIRR